MSIQDPAHSEMEKRLILAILLSMAVLFLTPWLYQKMFPPVEVPEREIPLETTPVEAAVPLPPEEAPPVVEEESETPATTAAARVFRIENANLQLTVSNEGGVLRSVLLKNYAPEGHEALELLPQRVPADMRYPLALAADDDQLNEELRGAVYEVEGVNADPVQAPATVTLTYRRGGLEVVRRLEMPDAGYSLKVETSVRRDGRLIPHDVVLGPGIGELDPIYAVDFLDPAVAYYLNGSVVRYAPDDLEDGPVQLELNPQWAGLDSKRFAYLVLNPGRIRDLRMITETYTPPAAEGAEASGEKSLLRVEVGVEGESSFTLFLGPKDPEVLLAADPSLPRLIDYGWFAFLVQPLLYCLKFVYGYVHNYGWAIIILTFIINLALFPVRYKQMASMKQMAEIQPKLRSVQDRYKRMKKDDPRKQQMNAEVMALYKEHGVNPLGGCLPLVIQMPFLFAFYSMLDVSIELRGAPFIFWIRDLSLHDPYYVTPIVMGLTMVAQQKMTPAVGDPTQRRMMMILPVVFTFFFLNLSSGLVLYFLFSNVFAMMLQFGLQRLKPELMPGGQTPVKSSKSK